MTNDIMRGGNQSARRGWVRALGAVVVALAGGATAAHAQDLGVKAPEQQMAVAIVNATVYPVSGPAIEDGYVVFERGRITEVGGGGRERVFVATTRVIDAQGGRVYPGLIGSYTQLGLTEIQAVRSSTDTGEVGQVTPEARAVAAVNPDSTLLPVTRSSGVLSVGTFPGGGAVAGQTGVISLEGWTWEDMTVEAEAGLVVNWPGVRAVRAWWMDQSEEDQRKESDRRIAVIRGAFREAEAYWGQKKAAAEGEGKEPEADIRWEAMGAYIRGGKRGHGEGAGEQGRVFLFAQEHDQILSAIAFAKEFGLRGVIVGGRDAPACAEAIKESGFPVIVSATFTFPKREDSGYDEAYTLPKRLQDAGIEWSLASGDDTAHERNLPYAAALAVAHGLKEEDAIRGITLSAAKNLGVESELGSLEVGKRATLIVCDASPLEVNTRVRAAFINGKEIDLSNKQTALAAKYREKYRQQREAGGGAGGGQAGGGGGAGDSPR